MYDPERSQTPAEMRKAGHELENGPISYSKAGTWTYSQLSRVILTKPGDTGPIGRFVLVLDLGLGGNVGLPLSGYNILLQTLHHVYLSISHAFEGN